MIGSRNADGCAWPGPAAAGCSPGACDDAVTGPMGVAGLHPPGLPHRVPSSLCWRDTDTEGFVLLCVLQSRPDYPPVEGYVWVGRKGIYTLPLGMNFKRRLFSVKPLPG